MRKNLLVLLVALSSQLVTFSQYWQQQVNYTIDVSLNDKEHTLSGFEKIEYINNSPDTLHFIWFHLWPNAYKNDKTAYTDQTLENGNTKFYFSDREQKGYINRLDFKVNSTTAQTEDHPEHIDIVKLILPTPLPPGQKTIITTSFNTRLPYNFSRGGHDGQSYQATQWYPKPAVYDRLGWHPMTYLDQGEFYSEFGSFDVTITVPANYVVAATGELQDKKELEWMKARSSFSWSVPKDKVKAGKEIFPESSKESKTLNFRQSNIHDFAWFADKRFIVNYDTCRLSSGKVIDVFTYYTTEHTKTWGNSIKLAKDGTRHYSELVGEYPYNVVSVVQGPESFGGGMEYPTITVISPGSNEKELDNTIAHEIGHNWFYGILGSNERKHPWMDEGINSYYDAKYNLSKYGKHVQLDRILFETKAVTKTDQPIELPSEKYSETNYYATAYYKTAEWLRYLESQLGTETFNKAMQEYYRRWQFKHPQPEDFKKTIEESSGRNLDSVFSYLGKTGLLPNQQSTGTKTVFLLNFKAFEDYGKDPSKNLIVFGPAIGANSYDKLMVGAFVTNMKLPPSNTQFLLSALYATGTKGLNWMGLVFHTFYPNRRIKQIDLGISGASFTMDLFTDKYGIKHFSNVEKFVPGIKLTLKEKDPRSNLNRYLQFKSFLLSEQRLKFTRQLTPVDTTIISSFRERSTLNQLQFVIENNRALYPYRGEFRVEQGTDFARAAFTGKYFFNYSKEGGLDVRLFAGKFFYTSSKTISKEFETDRYHLNMTGPNGYEDYTYSDYFVGRNKFEAIASQQIMLRDGAFKVRTDLLASKVGKTDDWLMAANFSTSIPSGLNPLSALPVKIPLKIFVDIGTNAEAWKQDAETDRFLFDAGLHIPLFFETVNIYIPLIYSGVYRDYFRSTLPKKGRLWKTVSFSIDISNFSFRKIDRNFNF